MADRPGTDFPPPNTLLPTTTRTQTPPVSPPPRADVDTLLREAFALRQQPASGRAEQLYLRALALLEQAPGKEGALVGTLNNLSQLYCDQGDYGRAEPLAARALAIGEKALGREHPDTATSADNLAWILWQRGDYGRAEPLARRALDTRQKAPDAEQTVVATSLTTLGVVLWEKGEYARAEPLLRQALDIEERAYQKHGPKPEKKTDLADRPRAPEKPSLAERPHAELRSTEAEVVARGAHRDLIIALNNLGGLYTDKGDFAHAEPLLLRAMSIEQEKHGSDDPSIAPAISHLARAALEREDFAQAEERYQRALTLWEKSLGREHPKVATALDNLGRVYRENGDPARAEGLFQRALAIREKLLGKEHPLVADCLDDLAVLYRETGAFSRARPLAERALGIRQAAYGKEHFIIAESLNNLASLSLAEGNVATAVEARERGAAIMNHQATLLLATGSEDQKRAYMVKLQKDTDEIISLHARRAPSDPRAARLALATILRRKGRVLDAMTDGFEALRRRLDGQDRALLEQLASVEAQLGAQVLRGRGDIPFKQHRANVAALEAERQRLESEVSARSAEFRAEQRPVPIEEVQQALPEGTALVEIVLYVPFDETASKPAARRGKPRYAVYVVKRTGGPAWVDLGEAAPIDARVAALRDAIADPVRDPRPKARALDAQLMQPIRAQLGGAHRVLLSPDGALNLIPFGALINEAGRYLLESFSFTYLTSGRELLRHEALTPPRELATIIANPAFGPFEVSPRANRRATRAIDMAKVRFGPLPGTIAEGRAVGNKLSNVRLLLGAEATESAVKALRGPRIVHIATHGFFLPPSTEAPGAAIQGRGATNKSAQAEAEPMVENPLLRAGLAFAGANQRESGADDGVLTALEASSLDLHGTRLVVLSACETGVGEAAPGEGVYGLRRALSIAGAETQVMSLWKVDDEATRALMVAYYAGLHRGGGRSEAMREAQLSMLATKATMHPYYWASFLVSGNGAPLDDGSSLSGVPKVEPGPRGCGCAAVGHRSAADPAFLLALLLGVTVAIRRRGPIDS
jgi:CHAT domain-containing protein/Tfp pilus assembly protein PilF